MDLEKLFEEKARLGTEMQQLREKITEKAKDAFTEWAKDIFYKYEGLKNITWSQYTPYFNDGHPCYFRSNHRDFAVNSCSTWEDFDDDEDGEFEGYKEARKEIDKFMKQFDKDDMHDLFGDHAQVTVTREGVSVDSYDHD